MSKSKKDECMETCEEATRLDKEADLLEGRSPEQLDKYRQAADKYERAIALLTYVADQELKQCESYKKANPKSSVSESLYKNIEIYLSTKKGYSDRLQKLRDVLSRPPVVMI
mmetsp:Transcript_80621/g.215993  ORF Transcript_80621/g.215993 Transcript_80621/m.215993 type:complete len:112 (+) Transcript_80621:96-431(+)